VQLWSGRPGRQLPGLRRRGLAYTGGPFAFGYRGLGDVAVFIFFGPVAVAGSHYVQALSFSGLALAASLPIGALATAILVVNNLRDIDSDARVGKRTLAVRIGARATRIEYAGLLVFAYAIAPDFWLLGSASAWVMLPLLRLTLAYSLLFSIGWLV